jgi:hypothetical protein
MKLLKAIAILIVGPLLGIVSGFIVGGLALPPDPNFATSGGHTAPGDGFAMLPYLFISFAASILMSVPAALWVLFRKPKDQIDAP